MMEKNKSQILLEKDFDQLVNQAFLNLDFDQPLNQALLESISRKTFAKSNLFPGFKKIILNKLIFLILIILLSILLIQYFTGKNIPAPDKVIKIESLRTAAPKVIIKKEKLKYLNKILIKKSATLKSLALNNMIRSEIQEKVVLSGYIKSMETGDYLSGVTVYKFNSDANVFSSEQGYFSLQLPKGENIIGVSLTGYQTHTFSIHIDNNTTMNFGLMQLWDLSKELDVQHSNYIFPNLTEKEKKSNEKEKQKMAKLAARLKQEPEKREGKYPFVTAPPDHAFAGFNMGSVEVTNLEYRTFLFDLLINGKKEEFLAAKPEQNLWKHAAGQEIFDTLASVYFSEKKYNFYPVVNISVTGAQMYCSWLAEQANIIRRKEGKPEFSARLPYEQEWLHAASGGHPGAVYPWPSDSIQNRYNWFLANCCIQKQADKFKYPLNKTVKYPAGQPGKSDQKAYTSAAMATGNKQMATVEVFAYNPNDFYLYCMSGNVSEMVYVNGTLSVKTKGGNWNSDFEHLKLNSEDEFKEGVKPSPMIGFRVCIETKK